MIEQNSKKKKKKENVPLISFALDKNGEGKARNIIKKIKHKNEMEKKRKKKMKIYTNDNRPRG